jgi:hypothetical protein
MKLFITLLFATFLTAFVQAFSFSKHESDFEINARRVQNEYHQGLRTGFDKNQLVDVTGDHAWAAPGPND